MDKALALIGLQKLALEAKELQECIFLITNKTHQLVSYDQAVFFESKSGKTSATSVSGNATIEAKGTHTYIIEQIIKNKMAGSGENKEHFIVKIDHTRDIPQDNLQNWKDFALPHNLLMVFGTEEEGIFGSLLLQRDKQFDDAEIAILEELCSTYSKALALQNLRKQKSIGSFFVTTSKQKKWVLAVLVLLFICPVRLSASAPAEIVAEEAKMVSAPFDGMIDEVLIKPGDGVLKGQILARMDQDSLRTKEQSAAQALELAKVSLSRVRRESIATPEKKAELNKLQAEINAKTIEYEYAQTLLERSEISAPQDGIAIFPSVNTLRGKPVAMGERLMLVASPEQKELLVRVPLDAMLDFNNNAKVRFHSNISPLFSYEGETISIGYQASPDPDGLLTYKIRASIPDDKNLRIGWKGTAKIYDEWSILGYATLRRPLIALRNIIGF